MCIRDSINAWSEISSMTTAFIVSMSLLKWVHFAGDDSVVFAKKALITVGATTFVWLLATLLTKPEPDQLLVKFYRRVRPSFYGWQRIAKLAPDIPAVHDLGSSTVDWIIGCALVYCAMFSIGNLVLHEWVPGFFLLAIAAISAYAIFWRLSRRGWGALSGTGEPVPAPAPAAD